MPNSSQPIIITGYNINTNDKAIEFFCGTQELTFKEQEYCDEFFYKKQKDHDFIFSVSFLGALVLIATTLFVMSIKRK